MPLTDPDEVFYAETAKEMLTRDELLTPFIFGEPQFEKPPLYYWTAIFSFKIFGINEFAARFPSAVFGILGVIGVYLLGRALFTERTGFLSGLILATSAIYLVIARACVTDMALAVFILYVFLFFFKKRYFLSAVALGLATLTKGPIGIFLPVVILGLYLIATKKLITILKEIPFLRAGALFLIITLPWYILMYRAHGKEFIDVFFGFHNITRYLHPEHAWGDVFYYYAPIVLGGFLPWATLLPAAIWNGIRERKSLFLFFWFLVIFLFFSFSRTKLPTYIFPLFPALAIFTGRTLDVFLEGEMPVALQKTTKASLLFLALAFFAGALGFYIFARIDYPEAAVGSLLSGLLLAIPFSFSVLLLFKKKYLAGLITGMASFMLFAIPVSYMVLPVIGKYESSKFASEQLNKFASPDEIIGAETDYRRGIAFYTGRENIPDVHNHHVITTLLDKPERVWCVIKEKNHAQLYTDTRPFHKPTYVVYKLGKKVILTNNPPAGVPVLKVRTKDEPY